MQEEWADDLLWEDLIVRATLPTSARLNISSRKRKPMAASHLLATCRFVAVSHLFGKWSLLWRGHLLSQSTQTSMRVTRLLKSTSKRLKRIISDNIGSILSIRKEARIELVRRWVRWSSPLEIKTLITSGLISMGNVRKWSGKTYPNSSRLWRRNYSATVTSSLKCKLVLASVS